MVENYSSWTRVAGEQLKWQAIGEAFGQQCTTVG